MRPAIDKNNILVELYLVVGFDLSLKAFRKGEILPISRISLTLSWWGKVKVKVNSVSIESENESFFFSIYTFTPEPAEG